MPGSYFFSHFFSFTVTFRGVCPRLESTLNLFYAFYASAIPQGPAGPPGTIGPLGEMGLKVSFITACVRTPTDFYFSTTLKAVIGFDRGHQARLETEDCLVNLERR